MRREFLTALLVAPLAIILQLFLRGYLGFYSDLTLAALVAFSLFGSLPELLFLTLAAVFILNWQPAPSADMLVFGLLPLVSFCAGKLLKGNLWAMNPIFIFLSFLAMYAIFAAPSLLNAPFLFIEDALAGMAFGVFALFIFNGHPKTGN